MPKLKSIRKKKKLSVVIGKYFDIIYESAFIINVIIQVLKVFMNHN